MNVDVERPLTPKQVRDLRAAHERLRRAALRVLDDVDDDGVAEGHDVAIYELREAVKWTDKS